MTLLTGTLPRRSRLAALLGHFAVVEDPRDERRILHPLPETLLLAVCGTIADCDDYEDIAAWGAAHIGFLRKHLPYAHGVARARWLTILMNRINPALFAAAFEGWVRESWPEKAGLVAIDGKTSRRSHDRGAGAASRPAAPPFCTMPTGSKAPAALPARCACRGSPASSAPKQLSRSGAQSEMKPDTSRHRGRSPPRPPRKPSANTGRSRTASDFAARRHLRRRPLPPAQGPRRQKHGHRPAFRPQPRPHRRRQAIHQVQTKTRRMGYNLPRRHPRPVPSATWIRSPGSTGILPIICGAKTSAVVPAQVVRSAGNPTPTASKPPSTAMICPVI